MHTQLVTFAFATPCPFYSWRSIARIKERAEAQGIRDISISRIGIVTSEDEGVPPTSFLTNAGRLRKSRPTIPNDHIAVLVEGFAEKE